MNRLFGASESTIVNRIHILRWKGMLTFLETFYPWLLGVRCTIIAITIGQDWVILNGDLLRVQEAFNKRYKLYPVLPRSPYPNAKVVSVFVRLVVLC